MKQGVGDDCVRGWGEGWKAGNCPAGFGARKALETLTRYFGGGVGTVTRQERLEEQVSGKQGESPLCEEA